MVLITHHCPTLRSRLSGGFWAIPPTPTPRELSLTDEPSFCVDMMDSERQVKEKLGQVIEIAVSRLLLTRVSNLLL